MAKLSPRILTQFTKTEISALFAHAKKVLKTNGLEIRKGSSLSTHGRLLLVTPKKLGSAPKRNRIRRQLKNIFYTNKLFEHPFDLIILVRPTAMELSFAELQELVVSVYDKGTEKKSF